MRVRLGKLTRLTAEAERSPTACLSSPEPRRKEEDGADGRDPPVSDRVREREMALGAGMRSARLGPKPSGPAVGTVIVSLFLLCKIVMYV